MVTFATQDTFNSNRDTYCTIVSIETISGANPAFRILTRSIGDDNQYRTFCFTDLDTNNRALTRLLCRATGRDLGALKQEWLRSYIVSGSMLEFYMWAVTTYNANIVSPAKQWLIRSEMRNIQIGNDASAYTFIIYHVASHKTIVYSSATVEDTVETALTNQNKSWTKSDRLMNDTCKVITYELTDMPEFPDYGRMSISVVAGRNDGTRSISISPTVLISSDHFIAFPTTRTRSRRHVGVNQSNENITNRIVNIVSMEQNESLIARIQYLTNTTLDSYSAGRIVRDLIDKKIIPTYMVNTFLSAIGLKVMARHPISGVPALVDTDNVILFPPMASREYTTFSSSGRETIIELADHTNNVTLRTMISNMVRLYIVDITETMSGFIYKVDMTDGPGHTITMVMHSTMLASLIDPSSVRISLWDLVYTYTALSRKQQDTIKYGAFMEVAPKMIEHICSGMQQDGVEIIDPEALETPLTEEDTQSTENDLAEQTEVEEVEEVISPAVMAMRRRMFSYSKNEPSTSNLEN